MLYFPSIGHAVAVGIGVGGVGRIVNVGHGEIGGIGRSPLCFVADIGHLNGVITPEIALFKEEPVVFRSITYAIAVGIALPGIGGVVTFRRQFRVSEFVEIGPKPFEIHITGLVKIKSVGIVVIQRIPRVRWVEPVHNFPTIGHTVGIRIVGTRVHELEIRIATGRGCAVNADVTFADRGSNGHDFTGQASLILKTVNGGVVSGKRP